MRKTATIAVLLGGACAAAAAADGGLAACRALADERERLGCYDALPLTLPAAASGEEFGNRPSPERAPEPAEVRARLDGKLSGWQRGTRFVLDNGQVWQSVDYEPGYEELENTAVTIKRNFFGTYWLELDKVHGSIRVQRVQ